MRAADVKTSGGKLRQFMIDLIILQFVLEDNGMKLSSHLSLHRQVIVTG